MHLCFKFCFIGEKCSWPIEIFASKNAIFDDSTLSAFFNHKTKVTAKMHGYVRKLVKFWINQMPQIILFTFLVVHQKMVGKLDGETCNFQCNLKIYVKKTWFIYLFILKWYKILLYFAFIFFKKNKKKQYDLDFLHLGRAGHDVGSIIVTFYYIHIL